MWPSQVCRPLPSALHILGWYLVIPWRRARYHTSLERAYSELSYDPNDLNNFGEISLIWPDYTSKCPAPSILRGMINRLYDYNSWPGRERPLCPIFDGMAHCFRYQNESRWESLGDPFSPLYFHSLAAMHLIKQKDCIRTVRFFFNLNSSIFGLIEVIL